MATDMHETIAHYIFKGSKVVKRSTLQPMTSQKLLLHSSLTEWQASLLGDTDIVLTSRA